MCRMRRSREIQTSSRPKSTNTGGMTRSISRRLKPIVRTAPSARSGAMSHSPASTASAIAGPTNLRAGEGAADDCAGFTERSPEQCPDAGDSEREDEGERVPHERYPRPEDPPFDRERDHSTIMSVETKAAI